jgi:hypothetical protein
VPTSGTFSPTLAFGGASVGITYGIQRGRYTQIGNRILFDLAITLTSKGSSTGFATIGGLPVAPITGTPATMSQPYALRMFNHASGSMDTHSYAYLSLSSPATILPIKSTATSIAQLADTDFTDTTVLSISGHYEVPE